MKLPKIPLMRTIIAFALVLMPFTAGFAQNESPAPLRVILQGHDPVAYFTEGKPVKGAAQFAHDWDEGRYYFANARNRDLFAADPDRYAPRFGGYCTGSMTKGVKNEADPEIWTIVDGRLYLFGSAKGKEVGFKARERLQNDPAVVALAQKNWQALGRQ